MHDVKDIKTTMWITFKTQLTNYVKDKTKYNKEHFTLFSIPQVIIVLLQIPAWH